MSTKGLFVSGNVMTLFNMWLKKYQDCNIPLTTLKQPKTENIQESLQIQYKLSKFVSGNVISTL